jgi:hypothetical protein
MEAAVASTQTRLLMNLIHRGANAVRELNTKWRHQRLLASATVAATLGFGMANARAHPGHDLLDHGGLHLLTSPYHLLAAGLLGAASLACASLVRRDRWRRALRAGGWAMLGLTVVLWGISAN